MKIAISVTWNNVFFLIVILDKKMNSGKNVFTFQDSFWNKSRERIDKIQIQEFIELKPFKEIFCPEVHINKDNRITTESLYCFNGLNIPNGDKILYHLYGLFRLIYDEVEQSFPNTSSVGLYYNESNKEHLVSTVKFASDIDPSKSLTYYEVVRKGSMNLIANDFIKDYFEMFFRRRPFFTIPLWGITKHLSICRTYPDYGGFVYYL